MSFFQGLATLNKIFKNNKSGVFRNVFLKRFTKIHTNLLFFTISYDNYFIVTETFRDEAAKTDIPKVIVNFLCSQDLSTRLQTLRAIGNLCIDHGKLLRF